MDYSITNMLDSTQSSNDGKEQYDRILVDLSLEDTSVSVEDADFVVAYSYNKGLQLAVIDDRKLCTSLSEILYASLSYSY